MTPQRIIRAASLAGIDLNVRGGELFAVLPTPLPPPDVLATIRANRHAIITTLEEYATIAILRTSYLDRCRPLAPDDLTAGERFEAATLATDLEAAGGLGQFVLDFMHTWNDISIRDRLVAAFVWELASGAHSEQVAAK
jgi:hypothetical protein